jgi:protein SCO1/2
MGIPSLETNRPSGVACAGLLLCCLAVLTLETQAASNKKAALVNSGVEVIPDVDEAPAGGNFSLDSAAGQVSLSDLRGSAVLLAFGFTHCPDVCPTTLSFLSSALDALDQPTLARVQGLFVTLDPKRDSVTHLDEYARYFHDSINGLTGTPDEIAQVAGQYGVQYATVKLEGSSVEYTINHSAATYLINPEGDLQFVFPYMTPPAVMAEAVEHVLSISNE